MDKSYKRSEDIDAKIQNVKLSYNAWRTLFLLDDETTVQQLVELLKEDNDVIEKAILRLLEENLIAEIQEKKEAVEPEAEPAVADEPALEEPASLPETADEPVEELTEAFTEEAAADEGVDQVEELVEPEEPAEAKEPEEAEPEIAETRPEETEQADEDIVLEEMPDEILPEPEPEALPEEAAEPEQIVPEEAVEPEQIAPEEEIDIKIHDEPDSEADMLDVDFGAMDTTVSEEKESEKLSVETPSAEQEPSPAPSGDQTTILVVDDSIVIRKMVEIALEDEDFNIETAVSGKDGLDKIDKVNPSLIILDLMLPDINGIDILKTVKASRKTPVIMLSGKDSPQMVENAKTAGADAFLPKPFKDDELKEQIHKLLNG